MRTLNCKDKAWFSVRRDRGGKFLQKTQRGRHSLRDPNRVNSHHTMTQMAVCLVCCQTINQRKGSLFFWLNRKEEGERGAAIPVKKRSHSSPIWTTHTHPLAEQSTTPRAIFYCCVENCGTTSRLRVFQQNSEH